MTGQAPSKLHIEGVAEFWFQPDDVDQNATAIVYRPAALIECKVNFRSLRAGLNHSEERSYTAWIPEGSLAIDWDRPVTDLEKGTITNLSPCPDAFYKHGIYLTTLEDLKQYEDELIDKLVRNERLRIFFNPVFGLFSAPEDALDEFLANIAEAALRRVEPELRRLRGKFELQLEQIREAHSSAGAITEELSIEGVISQKLYLFESENRLAGMFSTLAGSVFGATKPKPSVETPQWEAAELLENLDRLEHEAKEALRILYNEYRSLASEYDTFEIGLQPKNIQVTRCALLWVPETSGQ